MRIKPEIGSVVGPTDPTHWGQTILSPTAYGVVELESPNAQKIGIELLTELSDSLKEPPVSLSALETLTRNLHSPAVKTIILLVPVGSVIYVALAGMGAVYLKRGEAVSCLLGQAGAISGEVKEGDSLILVSASLATSVPKETIVSVFDHSSARDAAEKLTLFLHESEGQLGMSALIFQVARFIHTEEEKEPVPAPVAPRERPMKTMWRLPGRITRRLPRLKVPHLRSVTLIAGAVTALFVGSVLLGVLKNSQNASNKELTRTLLAAQHAFDEGVALMDLNPVKGRERLVEAKTLLEPYAKTSPTRTKEGLEAQSLYQKITDNLTAAMHVVRGEPVLFFDASFVKKGGRIDSVSVFEDTLGLLDQANRSVYTLAVSSKRNSIVGGGEAIQGATSLTAYADKLYVVTDSGISQIRLLDKKTVPNLIAKAPEWGTIRAIVAYTGNLYLLDSVKSRIWKYVATESGLSAQAGFSEIREYLNPDTLPDFSRATGMAIDGSVWIGTNNGHIFRFTQGKENTFVAKGIEPALGSYLLVYTSEQAKNVYILDRDNKRIVVVDKDGLYLGQYAWEGNLIPSGLVVSEAQKKLLLLADGKLYALDLK